MPSLRFGRFSINEPALTYDTGFYSRFQKAQQQQTLTGLYEQQRLAAKSKRILDLAIHDPKAAESAYNADPELSAGGLVRFEGTLAAGNVFTDAGTGTRFVIGPNGRLVQITGSSTAALELSEARRRQAQAAADKGVVANTAEGVYLVNPTVGETSRRLGGLPPSRAAKRAPTTNDLALAAINGDEEAARVLAATGGVSRVVGALTRRTLGQRVPENPEMDRLTPEQATAALARLNRFDVLKQVVNDALLGALPGAAGAVGGPAATEAPGVAPPPVGQLTQEQYDYLRQRGHTDQELLDAGYLPPPK